jgi:putative PIN family toxin of toxin-antitoxin system
MPKDNLVRLIIDTNIWISFLISDKYQKLDKALSHPKTTILFSIELLEEINRVATFPKLKKYFSLNAVEEMLLSLEDYVELVKVKSKVEICRDLADNFLLGVVKRWGSYFFNNWGPRPFRFGNIWDNKNYITN